MNLEYSASEAIRIAANNPARVFGGDMARSAKTRLDAGGYFDIQHKPKFKLERDWPVFTIGSCFAREVENALSGLQVPLVVSGFGSDPKSFIDWDEASQSGGGEYVGVLSRRALNKYDAHAMSHELKRTILGIPYPNEGLIELAPDKWFDPHGSALRLCPLETALENRKAIATATAQIKRAKVVIITLGLTESWIDTETGLAINEHPDPIYLRRHSHRFKFVDYGFRDIASEVHETVRLIREVNTNMKIVITVSPVTLWSTFRDIDVVTANSGSKAVLRAVSEEISRSYDFVDYFPSYELVSNTPRHLAWLEDQHHVARPMVAHVMALFGSSYYAI